MPSSSVRVSMASWPRLNWLVPDGQLSWSSATRTSADSSRPSSARCRATSMTPTLPGTRSSVSGPAFASLGELLRRHGLEYRNTDAWVTASVADDGRGTLAHRDPERTVAGFAHETDRIAYLAALSRLNDNIESIGGLMASELRSPAPFRHLAGLFRNGGRAGVEQWLRSVASSGRGMRARNSGGPRSTISSPRGCCTRDCRPTTQRVD